MDGPVFHTKGYITSMDKTDRKEFLAFLKKNKVRVKGDSVHVDDVEKAHGLIQKFHIEKAKRTGLPKDLVPFADTIVRIEITDMERNDQKPEKYDLKLTDPQKSYETGLWSGHFEGKVKDIYKYVLEECDNLDISWIADCLFTAVEENENEG